MDAPKLEKQSVEEIRNELPDHWESLIDEADQDDGVMPISMRWNQSEVRVVKQAAA
jgi:hypothetical protein